MLKIRSRASLRAALFLVAFILLGCQKAHQDTAGVPEGASSGEAIIRPTPAILKPPGGIWLKDAQGREYFVDRWPKRLARRIDRKTVRTTWGLPLDVVREDDGFYYYRVYKPTAALHPNRPQLPSAQEVQRVQESYRSVTPVSERLRFVSFGNGLPSTGQWRNGFAVADMNGDGHPDIVHGPPRKSTNPVPVILLGDGKGSWSRWREVKFPALAYDYGDVQVGDLNGDGHLDLVFGVHLRGLIALLGDGKGTFREWGRGLDFSPDGKTAFSSQAIRIIDWNGDGKPDILALSEGPGTLGKRLVTHLRGTVLYLNRGDGTWERSKNREDNGRFGLFGESLTIGDFDGDGHPDFATSTNVMDRRDLVNLWRPKNGWETLTLKELRPMAYVWSVAAADFDGDGRADLAVAYTSFELSTWRSGIDILYSRAGGHWERQTLVANDGLNGPVAVAAGDLGGDGHKDVVALTATGGTLVFLGDGRGHFTEEKAPPPAFPGACRGSHVELADLDGDGKDEMVAAFADEPEGSHCPSGGGLVAWKAQLRTGIQ